MRFAVHGAPVAERTSRRSYPMLQVPYLPTVGEIARRLDRPLHCIEYVIRSRGIRPIGKAGNSRVFDEGSIQRISSELRRMDAERGES